MGVSLSLMNIVTNSFVVSCNNYCEKFIPVTPLLPCEIRERKDITSYHTPALTNSVKVVRGCGKSDYSWVLFIDSIGR